MSNPVTGDFPIKSYMQTAFDDDGAVIKETPGVVFSVCINNPTALTDDGAFVYLKLYDQSLPVDGSVDIPIAIVGTPAESMGHFDFSVSGLAFNTGITFKLTTNQLPDDAAPPPDNCSITVCYY